MALVFPSGPHDLPIVVRLRRAEPERDPAHPLRGHSSPPRRHDSPQATTAYLTFPRLFKEQEHLVSVHTALILAGGESRRFGCPPPTAIRVPSPPRVARRPRCRRPGTRSPRSGPSRVSARSRLGGPRCLADRPLALVAR